MYPLIVDILACYFNHVLRGLRRQPPGYLDELLRSGDATAERRPELKGLAGIAVVRV